MPIYAQSSTLRNLTIPLLDIDHTTLQQDDILQYNASTGRFENQILSSGGNTIVTSGSNTGIGVGVFKQKDNNDLEFKSLTGGAGINITDNGDDIEITNTVATLTASNIGGGQEIYAVKVANDFQFRTLTTAVGSINLVIQRQGDVIEFNNNAEINTASNLGAGEGVFAQKTTYDLEFKSITAGDNVTVSSTATEIQISATNEPDTATSYQFGLTFDGNGDVDTITNVPSGWTITRVGNIITVLHNKNTMPKSISYWGRDSVNGWQYRIPTAGYQATIDSGDELVEFKIDVNANTAGADASSEARVNVIF